MHSLDVTATTASTVVLASGLITALFALSVWRRREATAARALAGVLVGASVWSLAYGLELASTGSAIAFWGDAKYVGVGLLPAAWFVFALRYTAHDGRLTRPVLAAIVAEPLALLVLLAIPETHDLVRYYRPSANSLPDAEVGPLFWVHVAYAYALLVVGTGALVVSLVRSSRLYRRQSVAILAALAVPWASNALYNFNVQPVAVLDPTPVGFCFAAVVLVWGVFRLKLLDVMPVARTRIVETMRDAVIVLDPYERVLDLNPSAQRLLALALDDAIGRPVEQLMPALAPPGQNLPGQRELSLHSGSQARRFELTRSPLADGPKTPTLLVLRDITERKLAEERLDRLAHYDALTGLPNRKLFGDRLRQALAQARRTGEGLALFFFDLDHFKLVNDTLGHEAGDLLLAEVAQRLRGEVREGDTLARLSGDEFTLLAPGVTSRSVAAYLATKLLGALRRPFNVAGRQLFVTASIGVAQRPMDGESLEELLRHADTAMYQAKRRGRDRFEFHLARTTSQAAERLQLEADLRRALDREELLVRYQPYVSLTDGAIRGAEALVRWPHPTRGLLPPSSFLPLAQEMGLMTAVDRAVLAAACGWAARHSGARGRPAAVGVNLSAAWLEHRDLVSDIAGALDRYGLAGSQLTLEISEQIGVARPGDETQLTRLKGLGVRLALDDFGSGSTSLGQLKELPLDQVKIDRRFVDGLLRGTEDRLIVSAMVNLAHTLGLSVVAEGVERSEQVYRLRELRCDTGQGFLFSRPVSPSRAGALLRAGSA